ncbi:hypothetical protein O181_038487 [Austropuccinia psidii MF-1]|uniref:Uncharacterized protein n=1 Tax=Austropuccinia psidii MF-1 TaxID=1389203 RepID=A0A9Q3DB12_9BASI|nr:hypothetical protein [Austropuccinia psidii MF-1]
MGFKRQSNFSISSLTHFSTCNHTNYFPLPIEQNPPNPPQQDIPVPHMPCKQTPQQPTPGPSGTQWSEDLFCGKQQAIPFVILTFNSSELTLPPFVEPSQHNEPPIPGPSKCSKPQVPSHEDALNREPEPEEALTQSTGGTFCSPPPLSPSMENLTASSPQSYNEAWQEFTDLHPTLMIPQAIVYKSIRRILLEHRQLLHMIPFVEAPEISGGTKLPPWPCIGGLSKGGHHRDSPKI